MSTAGPERFRARYAADGNRPHSILNKEARNDRSNENGERTP
jgi:hypothetical protein